MIITIINMIIEIKFSYEYKYKYKLCIEFLMETI